MKLSRRVLAVACALFVCLWSASTPAAETRIRLRVEAGAYDRADSPVTVRLTLPADLARASSATVVTADGRRLPAQLTPPSLIDGGVRGASDKATAELHFILPRLAKGEAAPLAAEISSGAPAGSAFHWTDVPGQYAELARDGRPVLRYVHVSREDAERLGDTYFKPYHHLYDPRGRRFVTKGDKDGLYPHHRGLFYGFSRISYEGSPRVNTWGGKDDHFQSHAGFLQVEAGPVLGRHTVAVDWHGDARKVFAKERRELAAYGVARGTLVEFASRLESTVGPVKLDGDPQHAGFQFRAAQEVADHPESTRYLRPDGPGAPGETRNWDAKTRDARCVNMPWNACSFEIGGQRYTALYVDCPSNPKESRWSERDYGRFGAYFEYELAPPRPLVIRYRVWLQEGEMTVAQAQALADDFAHPVKVALLP